ncbi:MAG: transcription-repair coupling factor, partial [Vibrio sp.]
MTKNSLLSLFAAQGAGDKKAIGNLPGASLALAIAELANAHHSHTLLAVPDPQTALKLLQEIEQFSQYEVALFPDWETLPYDNFSPHQDIISDRIARLYQLPSQTHGITIVPISTLLQRQSPRDFLLQHTLIVKRGDHCSLDKLRLQLTNNGYRHVDQVFGPGEYASRGSILDLFTMGSSDPFRIDFFDDEIDTIRTFDPDNQRSIAEMDEIRLLPAHEFPTSAAAIEEFRNRWRQRFEARREPESVYSQVSKGTWPAGIEYWQPLFFEHCETLFDYLPTDSQLLVVGEIEQSIDHFLADVAHRYDQRNIDPLRPLLAPNELWLRKDELFSHFKALPQILLSNEPIELRAGRINPPLQALPPLA